MKKTSFEEALKAFESIVQELETGDLPLEAALKKFEEGVKLSKLCSRTLDETEKKISILMQDSEANLNEEPFLPETSKTKEPNTGPDVDV